MTWKKKEKLLSPEEAIALAKKELAPFWLNSEPLLASFKTEAGAYILPLNSEFSKHPWLLFFLDPAEYSGESAYYFAREWHRRYHSHKLGFIVLMRPSPVGVKGGHEFVKKFQVQTPIVVDLDSVFASALGVTSYPTFVVLSNSAEVVRGQGIKMITDDHLEEKIQKFLRQSDPGLALPLSFHFQGVSETGRVDFGTQMKPSSFSLLAGSWTQGEDFVRTEDPKATLEVFGNGSRISMVARSGLETLPTSVQIEPLEGSFGEDLLGEGMSLFDGGLALGRVQGVALYHLLKGLPAGRRKVRLSFPDADRIPVILYGLRFGEMSEMSGPPFG